MNIFTCCCQLHPVEDEAIVQLQKVNSKHVLSSGGGDGLFMINLQKSPTEKWGLDLEMCLQSKLLVVDVYDGPIRRHNEMHADAMIMPGDIIENVNGLGSSARQMAETLGTSDHVLARIRKAWYKEEDDSELDATAIGSESSMQLDLWQTKNPQTVVATGSVSSPVVFSSSLQAAASPTVSHRQVVSPSVSHRPVTATGALWSASIGPGAPQQVASPFTSPVLGQRHLLSEAVPLPMRPSSFMPIQVIPNGFK
mmetsp:Transcript_11323/g.21445  ORF Transcript_11323/g.21445 Transcript_11323/m.21445 type:complete len:253 (+) Transcript_11323:134-892(+)